MSTGFHLENLLCVVHANKMHLYAKEHFVRQVELAQGHSSPRSGRRGRRGSGRSPPCPRFAHRFTNR